LKTKTVDVFGTQCIVVLLLLLPAGWLPRDRDQLQTQRSYCVL